jgi:hypothetical protein
MAEEESMMQLYKGIIWACVILHAGYAFGGWQADQSPPVATATSSPFSLEQAPPAAPPGDTQSAETPPAQQSPFALPDTPGRDAEPAAADSPFALPASLPGASNDGSPAVKGTTSSQDSRSSTELLEEGLLLAGSGKLEEARVMLARAVQKDPANVVALNNLGLVLRRLDRLDDALTAYQYALQVDATYPLTYKNLGVLLEKRGEKRAAAEAYREYCRLDPGAEDAKNVSARAKWLEQQR